MTTKVKSVLGPKKVSPAEARLDEVLKLVRSYRETAKAIFHDYNIDADAWLELATAEDALEDMLMDMKDDVQLEETDFDYLLEKLKALDVDTYQQEELLELVTDDDLIINKADELNILVLKVDSLMDRQKLQDYINENIYPYNVNLMSGINF